MGHLISRGSKGSTTLPSEITETVGLRPRFSIQCAGEVADRLIIRAEDQDFLASFIVVRGFGTEFWPADFPFPSSPRDCLMFS